MSEQSLSRAGFFSGPLWGCVSLATCCPTGAAWYGAALPLRAEGMPSLAGKLWDEPSPGHGGIMAAVVAPGGGKGAAKSLGDFFL